MHAAKTFQLKGSLFTLTVLRLQSVDFSSLGSELQQTLALAPKFFDHAPIVVDLQSLATLNIDIDFTQLLTVLKNARLIPIGVRNGTPQQHEAAVQAQLAVLPSIKSCTQEQEIYTSMSTTTTTPSPTATRVITQPVRSGSQVYAEGGDLLVLAPVSHGAEVIADGNIHIYGPLRGRALAGVRGNKNARIFCMGFAAELIAIAGHYQVNEEFSQTPRASDKLTHIYLDNEKIIITDI